MTRQKSFYIEVVCHLLFWSVPTYFSIRYNIVSFGDKLSNESAYVPFIANTLYNILLVYANIFLIFPAYTKKRLNTIGYALLLTTIVIISAFAKYEINNLSSLYYFSKCFMQLSFREIIYYEAFIAGFFVIQSTLYCAVKEWINNRVVNSKLQEEKLILELKYLKAQINPHFLFNTLNNLYSIALRNNDNETADGLTRLSTIMRYMLNDINENEIDMDKEIDYLRSYIELQKLRFSSEDDIQICFDIQRDSMFTKIPPFIFIVFIENAFKYGINLKKHSFINIKFEVYGNLLRFNIKNSVNARNDIQRQGVGLNNVTERLRLLFGDAHKLNVSNENNIFNVDLEIKLKRNT
jgi:two-component system, LytTR family, sensor kinase